jgi:hypothetical protein
MRSLLTVVLMVMAAGSVRADTLNLQPVAASGSSGSYLDFDVILNTDTRPVGAVAFDINLSPATNVLRFVGAYVDRGPWAGGGQPEFYAGATNTGTNIHIAAFNAVRPDVPHGTNRFLSLRFQVEGEPGDSCAVTLTNVALYSTAAFPTNDMAGSSNEVPCRPLAVAAAGATLTIPAVTSAVLRLTALPDTLERNRLYPVNLTADCGAHMLAGFDVVLLFPTSAVRVLDVTPNTRQVTVTCDPSTPGGGSLRLVGVNARSVWQPAGTIDLATIWLDAKQDATGAVAGLQLQIHSLLAEPGLEMVDLNTSNWDRTVSLTNSPMNLNLAMSPSPTGFLAGTEFETPVSVQMGDWAPVLLGGQIHFDTGLVQVVSVVATDLFGSANLTVDTNAFNVSPVSFLLSNWTNSPLRTNGVLPVLNVHWQVSAAAFRHSSVSVAAPVSADGIWNGINAVGTSNQVAYWTRYSSTDADGDGMPDAWEALYDLNPTNPADATVYGDSDPLNNLDEYIADTDPTNPASCFAIVALSNQPPSQWVFFPSSSNRVYALQWRTNLMSGAWTNLPGATPTTGNGGLFWLSDTNAASPRFYRVGVRVP